MKVIRFMTGAEVEVFLSGGKLMSCEKHDKHNKTTSVGFCFAEVTDVRTPRQVVAQVDGHTSLPVLHGVRDGRFQGTAH